MHRDQRTRLTSWLVAACLALAVGACTRPSGARPVMGGKELFAGCAACHGAAGEGSTLFKAPALAGLPGWYLEAQLVKFQNGVRGAHPDDVDGLRMRPMSRTLMNRDEVKSVSGYLSALPAKKFAPTLAGGDAAAGAALFGTCLACHGPAALGNEQFKAPPLAGQADWYLLAQLTKFKDGVRGTNPADTAGALMRPMAMTLADEQAMKNVVAHITTFPR